VKINLRERRINPFGSVCGYVEIKSEVLSGVLAERSAPITRWKRLAGGLTGKRARICAQEKTCGQRCIGAFDCTQSKKSLGVPVQQPPYLLNASAVGFTGRTSRVRSPRREPKPLAILESLAICTQHAHWVYYKPPIQIFGSEPAD
jgi:hypothetical protein